MKVLHIIPSLRKGGAETLVVDLVKALNKRSGVEVRLILFHDVVENDVVEIKHLIQVIPSKVKLSVYRKNTLHVAELQHFITTFEPDIIHSHLFEAELVSRSCYYPQAKWFSHGHGFFPEFKPFTISFLSSPKLLLRLYDGYYLLRRYKANGNNTYIAVSEAIKAFISNKFSGSCLLLYNAIQPSFFKASKAFVDYKKPLRLVSAGRFDENKNQTFLLDVVAVLAAQKTPVHLTLLGDGKTRPVIEQKIATLGLAEHITLAGIVNNMHEQYEHFDLYVHAAKKEAFGLTLVEAMAAGLPVVSLNGGGNSELIQNGQNGALLHAQDAHQFSSEILKIWTDGSRYIEMSNNAQSFAQNFRFNHYVDNLMRIYSEALA